MKNTENKIEAAEVEVANDALEQVELTNVDGGRWPFNDHGYFEGFSAEVTGFSCDPRHWF
jgi:hypothetical protein